MKFSELPERRATAIASLFLKIVEVKSAESQEISRAGLQLLVIGNGAGILVLATFMGAIVQKGDSLSDLISPLIAFLVGATLGALIYIPLNSLASNTAGHLGTTIEKFFNDQIELEDLQGYSLTKRGKFIVNGLLLLSILCFFVGVVLGIIALYGRA